MFSKIIITIGLALFLIAGCGSVARAQTCVTPPAGLISWYRGQNNANDSSGNGNHGTPQGGATFAAGKVGQAFSLDGSDDSVVAPATAALVSSFTVEAWINPSSLASNPVVFERGGSTVDRIGLQLLTSGTIGGYMDSNSGFNVSGGSIPINGFTHIAYVLNDAANSASLYVNGVLVASASETRSPNGGLGPLTIGNSPLSGFVDFFVGLVDELSIYNRALSASEISDIFNADTAGKCITPSAAAVSVSGRVITTNGSGIAKVSISLTDELGNTRTTMTNPLGFYKFEGVLTGGTYVVQLSSKRNVFANNPAVIFVADEVADLDFTALP
jgi:hypothetical protein